MEIICQTCKGKLSIPDEKIPKDTVVRISCPHCKNKITVSTKVEEPSFPESPDSETPIEAFEEEEKRVLICEDDPHNRALLISALKELNYKPTLAANVEDFFNKVKFTQYDLIILNEEFANNSPDNNPIRAYIQPMPMPVRRYIFFALIGKNFKTLDNLMAFSMSANVVINIKDLPSIKNILKKSIADHERFYKIFMDSLKMMGKR